MDNILRLVPRRHDDRAVKIGALYAKARRSLTDSLKYLIEAGRELQTEKDSLSYGEWLPWLKANEAVLGFKERTAQRLMDLAAKCVVDDVYGDNEAIKLIRWVWGNEQPKPYTGDNEWYTPAEYIDRARRVLGGIDLDPASNEQAQRIVQAGKSFTKDDDALTQDWCGRIWLNPPYSKGLLLQFVSKLVREIEIGNTTAAIALLNNFTDADWFQLACSVCAAICFPRGRIYFENASGKTDRPLNGQVFFYYGHDVGAFRSEFSALGCGFSGVGSWARSVPMELTAGTHPLPAADMIGTR